MMNESVPGTSDVQTVATNQIPMPFTHQTTTTEFINDHENTLVTSDPGTGKTRSVLDAFNQTERRLLVLCPKSIMYAAWGADIEKFTPGLTYSLALAGKKRELAFTADTRVVILNHDGINWLVKNTHHLETGNWWICIDEFTAFKNPQAKRTKALIKLRNLFRKRISMSGTPMPNTAMDLFAPMLFLDGGVRLGNNFFRLRSQICQPKIVGAGITTWIDRPDSALRIAELVFDINVRHKLEDVIDMPQHFNYTRTVELDPRTLTQYNDLKDEAILLLEQGEVTAVNAAVMVQKLMQVCAGTVYDSEGEAQDVHGERYDLVFELVDERSHSIIAYTWRHQLERLSQMAEARGIRWTSITSSMSPAARALEIAHYQDGRYQAIFLHPATAGHGITLTKASTVIWCSPTFSAEQYIQLNARHYRAGQTKRTEVINIAARDTWEEACYEKLNTKMDRQTQLLTVLTL